MNFTNLDSRISIGMNLPIKAYLNISHSTGRAPTNFFSFPLVLPHFINTFQLIGDQFHLLYWSHSYDRNYLIDLIDKLGRVFLNFRAMKLWRAHPHEVLYYGSRRTHIWVNRDNHFFMGLVRHNSIEHFKSQSKLAFVTCLSKRSIRY